MKIKISQRTAILVLVFIVGFASLGVYFLTKSRAATTFQPLEVGINWHAGWSNGLYTDADNFAIIDRMAEAGVKWTRIDMGWGTVEETGDIFGDSTDPNATYVPGKTPLNQWYVKKIDTAVNYANSKGIKVLGVWWTTPRWANGNSTNYQIRPANNADYAESLEWAAKYWKGRIDAWQVWNEADPSQEFWQAPDGSYGGTSQYADLLKAAYPAMKRGNPDAKLVITGASSVNDAWYSQLYGLGIKNYFDVMAVHPYQGPMSDSPLAGDGSKTWQFLHVPALRNVMVANGDEAKPIWFTEIGWSVHSNDIIPTNESWNMGVTDQQQGDYMVQAIQHAKNNWPYVETIMFYTDKNLNRTSGSASGNLHQNNFGLLRTDNSIKPAYTILANYLKSQTTPPPPPTSFPDANGNFTNTSAAQVFTYQNPPIGEASGLAVTQGLYLTFNDSGGSATVYAYNKSNQLIATITVPNSNNVDWEDIAVVPGGTSGSDDIYIADIGNNNRDRTNLKLYKFRIPSLDKTKTNQSIQAQNVTAYPITYNDGNYDAESLAIHPVTKRAYIVSKSSTSAIYEGPASLNTSSNVFTRRNSIPIQYPTAADISKDGKYFVVTRNDKTNVWLISNNDILASLTASPNGTTFVPPLLTQTEAVTFSPDSKHIVINSEYGGTNPPVWAIPNPLFSTMPSNSADLNSDTKVNIQDLSILLSRWGTNNAAADIDDSGTVNITDLSILLSRWTG